MEKDHLNQSGEENNTSNNGWRSGPGIPQNPEKTDWHWLLIEGDEKPIPHEWNADFQRFIGAKRSEVLQARYMGPCVPPQFPRGNQVFPPVGD